MEVFAKRIIQTKKGHLDALRATNIFKIKSFQEAHGLLDIYRCLFKLLWARFCTFPSVSAD